MTMIDDRVAIEELADHLHLGELLAGWHVDEFGHLYDPSVWNLGIAVDELAAMSRPGALPTTLVAFGGAGRDAGDVLGSASLLVTDDLAGFEDLTPWLASVYVRPDARGRGIGDRLVAAVVDLARRLGHDRVHLFTAGQEDYYLRRGWRPLATTRSHGHDATVMVRATSPLAARRAVSSRWCSDPDVAGAYSYLRVGATPADRDVLAGPIHPGLWFAGEATWRAHPATMHGAWFSGERAAAQVLAGQPAAQHVLVVGAGLAGIAAGRALTAAGVPVTVLEATDHVGGRACVDRSLGPALPLGGAWLHGTDGHPLVGLVESRPDPWTADTTFWLDHGEVSEADRAAARQVHGAVHAALPTAAPDESAGDVLRRVLEARTDLTEAARATVLRWITNEFESLYAAPLGDVSAALGWEDYELPGEDELITSDLGAAVEDLAAGLDVRLGHRVAALTQRDRRWTTDTGLVADAVVVTVPIGALRGGRIAFDPPLPRPVLDAIDHLGAGPVTKLFVTYDAAWWPGGRAVRIAGPSPLVVAVDVSEVAGGPTLCWFSVGDDARRIESMTEDEQCRLADSIAVRAGLHA